MKTITLKKETNEVLLERVEKSGVTVSKYAREIALKMPLIEQEETFEIETKTVAELGFTKYPTTTELFAKIKSLGYELCLPQVALYLAMETEETGYKYIAMEPITGSVGGPRVFDLGRHDDGERWLGTDWTDPDDEWRLDSRIVFRFRKVSLNSSPQSLGDPESKSETVLQTFTRFISKHPRTQEYSVYESEKVLVIYMK